MFQHMLNNGPTTKKESIRIFIRLSRSQSVRTANDSKSILKYLHIFVETSSRLLPKHYDCKKINGRNYSKRNFVQMNELEKNFKARKYYAYSFLIQLIFTCTV